MREDIKDKVSGVLWAAATAESARDSAGEGGNIWKQAWGETGNKVCIKAWQKVWGRLDAERH